jgi:hypothetical protein
MSKLQRTRPNSFALMLAAALLATLVAAFALAPSVADVRAQSRHAPRVLTPTPTPTPEPTPQGESESQPRHASADKSKDALVSFVVMEYDGSLFNLPSTYVNDLAEIFTRELGQPATVSVSTADRGGRQEARKRAKEEPKAYVVLFEVEENASGMGGGGSYSDAYTVKTYTYAPKTGDLKYTDTIYLRPYRQTATVGGIPVPVPTRRVEQYPRQLQLEQASRDAADRLLSRFQIAPPQN